MRQYQTAYARIRPKTKKPYTQIYLVRHCHPDYDTLEELGDKNMPLSKIGQKQRKLLNKKLFSLKIDKIFVSELVRAQETAEVFARRRKINIIIDSRFNEIEWKDWYKIKYFNMSEKTRIKRVKEYKLMDKKLQRYQSQGRRLLADIYEKNKMKNIAIFSHGNLIRSIVTGILHTDVIGFLSMEIYQSSVTKLVIDRNGYIKINYINNIGHLPKRPNEDLFETALNQ